MVMGVVCSWAAVSLTAHVSRGRGETLGVRGGWASAPCSAGAISCGHLVFRETEPHKQTPVCVMLESFLYAGRVRTN